MWYGTRVKQFLSVFSYHASRIYVSQVTAASATLYGLLSATDASFTLMTVNFHATLSDKFGRKPFLALSALGLGTGFLITYSTRKVFF